MLSVWLIVIFAAVLMRDAVGPPLLGGRIAAGDAAGISLSTLFLVGLFTQGMVSIASRRVMRTGSLRAVRLAERAVVFGRLAAVAVFVAAVVIVGWVDAVRSAVGDLVLVDELLCVLPPLAVVTWGWWAVYPVERMVREAILVRDLDEGRTVYPVPSRSAYVIGNIRHQLLLTALPLSLVVGWAEAWSRCVAWFMRRSPASAAARALHDGDTRAIVEAAGQLAGVVAVLVLSPVLMRWVWDTRRLDDGPLRDRIEEMCRRWSVRIRAVLVWRTHGGMINGAVMGLLGRFRYVLLTDALLDSLPERQVEAVMAHELGHVRHRHMPWLAISLIAAIGVAGVAIGLVETALPREFIRWVQRSRDGVAMSIELGATLIAFGAGLAAFGYVSRRFEWQADAFAVRHLSAVPAESGRTEPAPAHGPARATREAVEAMAGALDAVSHLNHIPRQRHTWRHGSIAARQARLMRMEGARLDQLAIDGTVRRLKVLAAAGVAAAVAVGIWNPGG